MTLAYGLRFRTSVLCAVVTGSYDHVDELVTPAINYAILFTTDFPRSQRVERRLRLDLVILRLLLVQV